MPEREIIHLVYAFISVIRIFNNTQIIVFNFIINTLEYHLM